MNPNTSTPTSPRFPSQLGNENPGENSLIRPATGRNTPIDMQEITQPSWVRIAMGVLDVLPVPNVHEVVKAVLKDDPSCKQDLLKLLKRTLERFDVPRTVVAVIIGLLMVLL